MHYKNGREAKEGDQMVGVDTNGKAVGGTLVNLLSGSETCNGNVLPANILWTLPLVSVKDCLHIDDMESTPCDSPEKVTE